MIYLVFFTSDFDDSEITCMVKTSCSFTVGRSTIGCWTNINKVRSKYWVLSAKKILLTVTFLTQGSIHQIQTLIVPFCSDGPEQLRKKLIQFPKAGRALPVVLALTCLVNCLLSEMRWARGWKSDLWLFGPCMSQIYLGCGLWLEWQEDVVSHL